MADGARAHTSLPIRPATAPPTALGEERGMPRLDVARGQLLQEPVADEGCDLVLNQPAIALSGLRGDGAHGAPMGEPLTEIGRNCELAGIDMTAIGCAC